MDYIFVAHIGWNLKVYIGLMVIKTLDGGQHKEDLKETLASIRKYNTRLNSRKYLIKVNAEKFLGFMLTNQGIEAN